jgi:hypothetical protein
VLPNLAIRRNNVFERREVKGVLRGALNEDLGTKGICFFFVLLDWRYMRCVNCVAGVERRNVVVMIM